MFEYFGEMWGLALSGNKQGIFFYASLYAFFLLGYSAIYQMRSALWPSTKGFLLSAEVEKFGYTAPVMSDQEYKTSALYKYKVGETEYEGARVSPWVMVASHNAKFLLERQISRIQRNEDGTINVFFNPNRPQKSYLIKPGRLGILLTVALASLPILIYWQSYHV